MQREEVLDEKAIQRVLAAVYEGAPIVSQAYSNFNAEPLAFPTLRDLEAHISNECAAARPWIRAC